MRASRPPRSTSSAKSSGRFTAALAIEITAAARIFGSMKRRATSGAWLEDRSVVLPNHDLELIGIGRWGTQRLGKARAARHLLLLHYPAQADRLEGRRMI